MPTWSRAALVTLALASPAGHAAAEPIAVGGWIGPRFYSDDSALGYITEAPEHPDLANGMVVGARISRPLLPWLVPELELPLSLTSTEGFDTTVLWFEPRLHARFEFRPNERVRPFVLLGGGAPISVSSKRRIFATDVVGEGYFGIGAHVVTGAGFQIRGDFRTAVLPGVEKRAVLEFEAGIGLWFEIGKGARRYRDPRPGDGPGADPDPDKDGIVGDADACPDRPEDQDDFDDGDGCPDIDNDGDRVLDIADKCPGVTEVYNGIDDDDGCPDTVPADLDEIEGTIEGVSYEPGETAIWSAGRRTLKRIAEVLAKHEGVKIRLTGYTDDREARGDKPAPEPPPAPEGGSGTDGSDAPEAGSNEAQELSLERAAVIKAVLVGLGIREGRITIEGRGAVDPVGDNDKRRGRQANRRVVLRRLVPQF